MTSRPACPYCGASVSATARYCIECGTPLAAAASVPSRRRMRAIGRVPIWLFLLLVFTVFSTGSVGGFRYTAGYWPVVAEPAGTPSEPPDVQAPSPPPPTVDNKEVAGYRRSVVSIQVRGEQGNSFGSGFIIDENGNVVTAAHVVPDAANSCITVTDDDGLTHPAVLVQKSTLLDVAVLRVPTMTNWPVKLPLASSAQLQPGNEVYVVGSPKGAGAAVRLSAEVVRTNDSRTIDDRYYQSLVQVSGAVVIQGSSGGPLVDKQTGDVVGIVIASGTEAPVAWAMPISVVAGLIGNWTTLTAGAPCSLEPAALTIPVTLATITPLSGAYGTEGADLADGVSLALRDMEDLLRAVGYDVRLRAYDDQSSSGTAREAAALAAHDPSVIGVVGSLDSTVTKAIAEALAPSGLVLVAPTAGGEELTDRGWSHVNRLVASARRQEQAAARFAKEQLNARAVFMIDDGTSAALRQNRIFEEGAQVITLPVVGRAQVSATTEYPDLLRLIRESRADAIYYAGGSDTALRMITALHSDGITLPIFSGQSLYGPRFEASFEPLSQRVYFSRLTAEPSEQFQRHFERVIGKSIIGYAAYGYDAASVILSALLRYGETNPAQMPSREEMAALVRQTKGYHGHTSRVTFDSVGENVASWIYFYEWINGRPEPRGSLY